MSCSSEWYYEEQELKLSPSSRDGISWEEEKRFRRKTCLFIEETATELKLPKLTIATAHVLFHRFFMRQSFKVHDRFLIAATCLFLAGKVEESPKRLGDVVKAYYFTRKSVKIEQSNEEFKKIRERIIVLERILLHTVAFDLVIEHPYKYIFEKVKLIMSLERPSKGKDPGKEQKELAQVTWNFLNDSMRSPLCLQYPPELMACAGVYLACLYLDAVPTEVTTNDGNPWWTVLGIKEDYLNDICRQLMELYSSNADQLPDRLSQLLELYPTNKNQGKAPLELNNDSKSEVKVKVESKVEEKDSNSKQAIPDIKTDPTPESKDQDAEQAKRKDHTIKTEQK